MINVTSTNLTNEFGSQGLSTHCEDFSSDCFHDLIYAPCFREMLMLDVINALAQKVVVCYHCIIVTHDFKSV